MAAPALGGHKFSFLTFQVWLANHLVALITTRGQQTTFQELQVVRWVSGFGAMCFVLFIQSAVIRPSLELEQVMALLVAKS